MAKKKIDNCLKEVTLKVVKSCKPHCKELKNLYGSVYQCPLCKTCWTVELAGYRFQEDPKRSREVFSEEGLNKIEKLELAISENEKKGQRLKERIKVERGGFNL